ncbi:bromodomain-containing protein [Rhizophagus clarus]|uniref:Bromodomain-containing protein n=1 Tax=Rhizophagus clarus TaxID=94130 RepID=A0A8H3M9A5_9GLOM|nr:bromodomain-containing protein [Rhizophagus clarus]
MPAVISFPKEIVKASIKNPSKTSQPNFPKKNIKLINFRYDILHKLENNSYAHLFYKYNEENIIEYPMDLFTINSKLENNQYTNLEKIFLILQTRKKGELKRARDNNDVDTDNSFTTRSQKRQNQILEENKNNVVYNQVVNDAIPVASAYENLVIGDIIPFIEILKAFLSTRSRMSLLSADESMLQAIVESLLPLKYRIPELSLAGDTYISLELKYISLVGLIKNQNTKFGANELEDLDKILEKENEECLLKRPYSYWSKEHKKTNQTTIGESRSI